VAWHDDRLRHARLERNHQRLSNGRELLEEHDKLDLCGRSAGRDLIPPGLGQPHGGRAVDRSGGRVDHRHGGVRGGDLGNVDVHVIKTNGAGIVTGDLFDVLNTPSTQNFNLTTTVTVGSTIDFDLGNADGWSYDNTPLAATITPEPATLTLLALGGAAVVARRRKARS